MNVSSTVLKFPHNRDITDVPYINNIIKAKKQVASNTLTLPFALDRDQLRVLEKLFPEILIESEAGHIWDSTIQHPILRALNRYANIKMQKHAKEITKLGGMTINIGGGGFDATFPSYNHICSELDSLSNCMRFTKNYKGIPIRSDPKYCTLGAQKCDFVATHAFAIDSLYDIKHEQIVDIFEKHKLTELRATLLLPFTLYDSRFYTYENSDKTFYHIEIKDEQLHFSSKDGNPVYVHNLKNLRRYLQTTAIFGPNFTIGIELEQRRGIFHEFRFVKTDYVSKVMKRHMRTEPNLLLTMDEFASLHKEVCFSRRFNISLDDYSILPDLPQIMRNRDFFIYPVKETKHWRNQGLLIPQYVVQRAQAYVMCSTFEKYSPNDFAVYLKGLSTKITVSAETIQSAWTPSAIEYDHVLVTLFIYFYVKKNWSAREVASLKSEINSETAINCWVDQAFKWFSSNFPLFFPSVHYKNKYFSENLTRICSMEVFSNISGYHDGYMAVINEQVVHNFVPTYKEDDSDDFYDKSNKDKNNETPTFDLPSLKPKQEDETNDNAINTTANNLSIKSPTAPLKTLNASIISPAVPKTIQHIMPKNQIQNETNFINIQINKISELIKFAKVQPDEITPIYFTKLYNGTIEDYLKHPQAKTLTHFSIINTCNHSRKIRNMSGITGFLDVAFPDLHKEVNDSTDTSPVIITTNNDKGYNLFDCQISNIIHSFTKRAEEVDDYFSYLVDLYVRILTIYESESVLLLPLLATGIFGTPVNISLNAFLVAINQLNMTLNRNIVLFSPFISDTTLCEISSNKSSVYTMTHHCSTKQIDLFGRCCLTMSINYYLPKFDDNLVENTLKVKMEDTYDLSLQQAFEILKRNNMEYNFIIHSDSTYSEHFCHPHDTTLPRAVLYITRAQEIPHVAPCLCFCNNHYNSYSIASHLRKNLNAAGFKPDEVKNVVSEVFILRTKMLLPCFGFENCVKLLCETNHLTAGFNDFVQNERVQDKSNYEYTIDQRDTVHDIIKTVLVSILSLSNKKQLNANYDNLHELLTEEQKTVYHIHKTASDKFIARLFNIFSNNSLQNNDAVFTRANYLSLCHYFPFLRNVNNADSEINENKNKVNILLQQPVDELYLSKISNRTANSSFSESMKVSDDLNSKKPTTSTPLISRNNSIVLTNQNVHQINNITNIRKFLDEKQIIANEINLISIKNKENAVSLPFNTEKCDIDFFQDEQEDILLPELSQDFLALQNTLNSTTDLNFIANHPACGVTIETIEDSSYMLTESRILNKIAKEHSNFDQTISTVDDSSYMIPLLYRTCSNISSTSEKLNLETLNVLPITKNTIFNFPLFPDKLNIPSPNIPKLKTAVIDFKNFENTDNFVLNSIEHNIFVSINDNIDDSTIHKLNQIEISNVIESKMLRDKFLNNSEENVTKPLRKINTSKNNLSSNSSNSLCLDTRFGVCESKQAKICSEIENIDLKTTYDHVCDGSSIYQFCNLDDSIRKDIGIIKDNNNNPFTYIFNKVNEKINKDLLPTINTSFILNENLGRQEIICVNKNSIPKCTFSSPNVPMFIGETFDVPAKIEPLLNFCIDRFSNVYDMCVAPGALYKSLQRRRRNIKGFMYVGPKHFKLTNDIKEKFFEYTNINETRNEIKDDSLLIIDTAYAGREGKHIPDDFIQYCLDKKCGVIVKNCIWQRKFDFDFDANYYFYFTPKTQSSEYYVLITNKKFNSTYMNCKNFTNYVIKFLMRNNFNFKQNEGVNQFLGQTIDFKVDFQYVDTFMRELDNSATDIPVCKTLSSMLKPRITDFKNTDKIIKILCGVAGSGKSHDINNHYTWTDDCIVITSTQSNMEDFLKNGALKKEQVYTQHTGLLRLIRMNDLKKRVYIDEFQEFSKIYISVLSMFCGEIILIGDPMQIPWIDFGKIYVESQKNVFPYKYDLIESKRCPPDVALMCTELKIPMVSTSAHRNRSVWTCTREFFDTLPFKMAPTRTTKAKYKCDMTVHEAKGQTRSVVGLVVESNDDYNTLQTEWLYVAITRHTDHLFILETNTENKLFNTLWAGIQTVTAETPLVTVATPRIPITHEIIIGEKLATNKITREHFEDVLLTTVPAGNENYTFTQTSDLGKVAPSTSDKKSRLITNIFHILGSRSKHGKGVTRNNFVKNYNANAFLRTTTMIDRYLKPTRSVKGIPEAVKSMFRGLFNWVDKTKCPTLESFYKHFQVTDPEELSRATNEYLIKLQQKLVQYQKAQTETSTHKPSRQNFNDKKIADILNITPDEINTTIDFFMKQQGKWIPKKNWEEVYKSGQGVSAVSKVQNIMFAAVSRLALAKVKEVLLPDVIITSGDDVKTYKKQVCDILAKWGRHFVHDNDFTQWDASNNEVNIYFDALMFAAVLGFPYNMFHDGSYIFDNKPVFCYNLLNYYVQCRTNWRQSVVDKDGATTIEGHLKQFSGQQHTLAGNTLNNMALTGLMYNIKTLICAMFQGDDSQIRGEIELIDANFQMVMRWGFISKMTKSVNIGEYVGYVIHRNGWMPDLMRRAAKTASKIYSSYDDFKESCVGLADTMSIVSNQYEKVTGIDAFVKYFNDNTDMRTTNMNSEVLFDYLYNIKEQDWADLVDKTTNNLYLPVIDEGPETY